MKPEKTIEKVGAGLADIAPGMSAFDLRYGTEDKPAPLPLILFGMQHVLIMFTAMIVAPLVIGQMLNLPAEVRTTMLAGVMFGCGIATIISSLGLGFVGARLPIVLGAYAVYIGPVVAMAKASGLAAASTAMLIGGVTFFIVSPIVGKMRSLFPPVVVGTLLVLTGVTLIRIAVNIAAGINTPYAGNGRAIALVLLSIGLILAINRLTQGLLRALSVFLALMCIYLCSILLGLADLSVFTRAAWFAIPRLLPYGWPVWPGMPALIVVIVYHFVAAIYTMSITLALCKVLGVDGSEWRVRGAIAADGLGSTIAAAFGGIPVISYDQNVGAVSLTGVGSRFVVAVAGVILVVMALVPKIGAVISIVPPFVLGGTLIFMFSMIVAVGVGILADSFKRQRDLLLFAASVGVAIAVDFSPAELFDNLAPSLRILASDGIVVGTISAVVLNLILPDR